MELDKELKKAIETYWAVKPAQKLHSTDKITERGAVVAAKHMDGFIALIRKAIVETGIPESCIFTADNYLPGYFRSSKNWDIVVISPDNKLLAAIELKSQTSSYGNNFNNRAEEALGTATDLWTAFREEQLPVIGAPWIGYLMLIGNDPHSTAPVKNYSSHFPVLPEFEGASYMKRYEILCRKLILERLYSSVALLWTDHEGNYGDTSDFLSFHRFILSLQSHLSVFSNESDK